MGKLISSIARFGGSFFIKLNPDIVKEYELEENDIVEFSFIKKDIKIITIKCSKCGNKHDYVEDYPLDCVFCSHEIIESEAKNE